MSSGMRPCVVILFCLLSILACHAATTLPPDRISQESTAKPLPIEAEILLHQSLLQDRANLLMTLRLMDKNSRGELFCPCPRSKLILVSDSSLPDSTAATKRFILSLNQTVADLETYNRRARESLETWQSSLPGEKQPVNPTERDIVTLATAGLEGGKTVLNSAAGLLQSLAALVQLFQPVYEQHLYNPSTINDATLRTALFAPLRQESGAEFNPAGDGNLAVYPFSRLTLDCHDPFLDRLIALDRARAELQKIILDYRSFAEIVAGLATVKTGAAYGTLSAQLKRQLALQEKLAVALQDLSDKTSGKNQSALFSALKLLALCEDQNPVLFLEIKVEKAGGSEVERHSFWSGSQLYLCGGAIVRLELYAPDGRLLRCALATPCARAGQKPGQAPRPLKSSANSKR